MKISYEAFHPLDHRIGSRYCREVTNFPTAPKGWGNVLIHARHWWQYKFDYKPRQVWHRWVLCRLGHHVVRGGDEIVMFWPTRIVRCCVYCHWQPPGEREAQQAYEARPKFCTCGHEMIAHRGVRPTYPWTPGAFERYHAEYDTPYPCKVLDCGCDGWLFRKIHPPM